MTTTSTKQGQLIDFKNVTVQLKEKKVLNAFSVRIGVGEDVAIIGPNGSGKSTLIRTITREYYPLAGDDVTCEIFGQNIWNIFELRSRLGIVSEALQEEYRQDSTAFDMVLSGFFSSIGLFYNHQVTDAMKKRVQEVLAFLEIEHLQETPANEMSSGEARRVLIGRALVHDPQALILDEPTNSLDLHAVHKFRELLRKIARSGRSIILVTHNLHDILPEIRRVILIKNGAVFKDGNKEEILTDAILSELFALPVHVERNDGYYHTWT
jgi:iron complex transport system ATP-binding protein